MQRISELEAGSRSGGGGGGGSNLADVNDRLVLVTARLEVCALLVLQIDAPLRRLVSACLGSTWCCRRA